MCELTIRPRRGHVNTLSLLALQAEAESRVARYCFNAGRAGEMAGQVHCAVEWRVGCFELDAWARVVTSSERVVRNDVGFADGGVFLDHGAGIS